MLKELIAQLFPGHRADWTPQDGVTGLGFCPLHNDKKSRSFSIYLSARGTERWKCFAEGISGSAVDLVMRSGIAGTSTRAGANAWLVNNNFSAESPVQTEQRERNELYTKFMNWCREQLLTSPAAKAMRAYLASRKVSSEVVQTAPIGFYPTRSEVVAWLKVNDPENVYSSELLLSRNGSSDYDNSIIFGYRSSDSEYTRFKLRNPQKEAPGTTGKKTCFLGAKLKANERVGFFSTLTASTDLTDKVILVEGEFDVLALASLMHASDPDSDEPFMCFSGGSAMKSNINTIKGLGGERIYIMPDNDQRGRDYVFDIATEYPLVFIVAPKEYEENADPASWCLSHDAEDLIEAFSNNRSVAYTWVGESLAKQLESASLEERAKLKMDFTNYAKKLPVANRKEFMRAYGNSLGEDLDSLIEEVANSDCAYRISRNPADIGFYYKAETKTSSKRGTVEEFRISNFIMETLKTIKMDTGDGNRETYCQVKMTAAFKSVVVDIPATDFFDAEKLKKIIAENLGMGAWIKARYASYVIEACVLLSPTYNIDIEEVVINHTGWRDDGRFYMPNCFIDKDGWHELGDTRVVLPSKPAFFKQYYFLKPEGDMEKLKKDFVDAALSVFGKEVGILILNHFLWTPMVNICTDVKPICLWLSSVTGTFKTTYISDIASLFGNFHGGANFETWRSTPASIEREGHYTKDVPFVVDDYKPQDISMKQVTTVIQNYGDRKGRGRMDSNTNLRTTYHVRGNLVVTAEDFPSGEASVLARTLLIKIPPPDTNAVVSARRRAITRLGRLAGKLPMIGGDYIAWRIRKGIDQDVCNNEVREVRADITDVQHGRIGETMAVQMVQWKYTREYFHLEKYDNIFNSAIAGVQKDMNASVLDEQAGMVFLDRLTDKLASGQYYLEGRPPFASTEHTKNAERVGWIDDKAIYLVGGRCIDLAMGNNAENAIKYTAKTIWSQLRSMGYIVTGICDPGRNSLTIKVNGSIKRVYPIKRGAVEFEEVKPGEQGDSGILSEKTDKERIK